MILSDRDIIEAVREGAIVVEPFEERFVQPASLDVRLGDRFLLFRITAREAIDVKEPLDDLMEEVSVAPNEPFVLHPGEFVLGCTYEKVGVSPSIAGQLTGKSSLGRLGIIVHATAGFLDPGNCLRLTLELHNIGKLPVRLYGGMPIAQMTFYRLTSEAEVPYGDPRRKSKYYGDEGPTASKMHENFSP
jgi:dCTP deaminase